MAPPSKLSNSSTARRKSSKPEEKQTKIITLKLSSDSLRKFAPLLVKEDSPSKDSSSAMSNATPAATSPNREIPPESTSNTPAPASTPAPSSMPPPTEIIKKRGVKRSSAVALLGPDGLPLPKVRGKPGPKKRPRLEDGSIDHSNTTPRAPGTGTAAHKLGPKANQGAINAGLRALDRSGKPCRRWTKGPFKLKSFTGVAWELPRWTAPPKVSVETASRGSPSNDSGKENKENSDKSNGVVDFEAASAVSQNIPASSPAPSAPIASSVAPAVLDSSAPAVTPPSVDTQMIDVELEKVEDKREDLDTAGAESESSASILVVAA